VLILFYVWTEALILLTSFTDPGILPTRNLLLLQLDRGLV
jgi:hypothetical protein